MAPSSGESSPTTCPGCGEAMEPGFSSCWHCGFECAPAPADTVDPVPGELELAVIAAASTFSALPTPLSSGVRLTYEQGRQVVVGRIGIAVLCWLLLISFPWIGLLVIPVAILLHGGMWAILPRGVPNTAGFATVAWLAALHGFFAAWFCMMFVAFMVEPLGDYENYAGRKGLLIPVAAAFVVFVVEMRLMTAAGNARHAVLRAKKEFFPGEGHSR